MSACGRMGVWACVRACVACVHIYVLYIAFTSDAIQVCTLMCEYVCTCLYMTYVYANVI